MGTFDGFNTIVRDTARQLKTTNLAVLVADALTLLDRFQAGETLTGSDSARLALALHTIEIRDKAMLDMRDNDTADADRWADLALSVPPAFAAPAAAVAGYAALLADDFDGGMEALSIAVICDPGYRMAHLLLNVAEPGDDPLANHTEGMPYDFGNPDPEWFTPLAERIALHEQLHRTS